MTLKFPITYTEGKHGFLFIDPSASHLGWCLALLDLDTKQMYVAATGMLWTKAEWTKAQRYRYMQQSAAILLDGTLEVMPHVIITESFFMNPKLPMGSAIVPTINALLDMVAEEKGVIYQELGPSAWRGILGIKAATIKGKRDYKVPTADAVKKHIVCPEQIPSNINRKPRLLPHDITDVLAIAIAVAKHHGVTNIVQSNTLFSPLDVIVKLEELARKI